MTTTATAAPGEEGQPTNNGETPIRPNVYAAGSGLEEMVANAMMARQQFFSQFIDPRRDIQKECGYPSTSELNVKAHYRPLYDREPIAQRVVQLLPRECWKVQPEVFDDEDEDTETEFELALKELQDSLVPSNFFDAEEGGALWEFLQRVDELAGIGQFGILFLGLDDIGPEETLEKPAPGVDPVTGVQLQNATPPKLLFMRAFDESLVMITQFETEKTSPRYGMPKMYQVTFSDPEHERQSGIGLNLQTANVHWTRVIHIADNLTSSEVFGASRLQVVFNRVWDLYKTYGGSAEMYWKGAFPGISFETHPQLGGDVAIDRTATREQVQDYQDGLQRVLVSSGMSAKTLAPQVVDPSKHIDTYITGICIVLGCPKRVFMGTERGELASSQDSDTWDERVEYRQKRYLSPRVIAPTINRLIVLGILPMPANGKFKIRWPALVVMDAGKSADIATKKTQAMSQYVAGGVEAVISQQDFLTKILGMTREEAEQVAKNVEDRIQEEDSGGSPLLGLVGGLTGYAQLFGAAAQGQMTEEQLKAALMLFFKLSPEKADQLIADGLPEPDPMAMGGLPPEMTDAGALPATNARELIDNLRTFLGFQRELEDFS